MKCVAISVAVAPDRLHDDRRLYGVYLNIALRLPESGSQLAPLPTSAGEGPQHHRGNEGPRPAERDDRAREDARGLVSLGRCRFVGFRTAAFGRKRLWLRLGRGRSSRFVLEGRFKRSRLPCRRRFHRRSYRRTLGGFACQGSLDDSRRLRRSLCSTLRRWLGCLRNPLSISWGCWPSCRVGIRRLKPEKEQYPGRALLALR